MRPAKLFGTSLLILILPACGYHLRGADNPLAKVGIERIYVEEFRNSTYRLGVEHAFTTSMIRQIQRARVFEFTNNKERADAILSGEVTSVDDSPSASSVSLDNGNTTASIATTFTANVACKVMLKDTSGRIVFADMFYGSKSHPASLVIDGQNIVHEANATAPLINESEQKLAIRYLAEQMMFEAHQKMVDLF